ncbi:MAG: neutral/alkaline non-lysosomal ceramidase N-terminal domain-containing protein [Pirellulales bacterium]|nr:neutral/alkaline non-lysosomal ceramidase N-terminal domain-containing protein [Pirellulales bacterium]
MIHSLMAGAAAVDVTPTGRQFLFGYPHVPRDSTGVHDPLWSSALFLSDGRTPLLLVANDVIYISRETARRVREGIHEQTGIPPAQMMITATHTHSGPMTVDQVSNEADPAVPKTDPRYVAQLEEGIVRAAVEAYRGARPAALGLATADGACVGGNRHDPAGPSDPEVPLLAIRDNSDGCLMALMVVCSMHPTVLHEDSTLVSADFPGMTRQYLQERVLGNDCPVLFHTGPCGNQSPRHVTQSNTFDEAARLGRLLGESIIQSLANLEEVSDVQLGCAQATVDLPIRTMPSVAEAQSQLEAAARRLDALRRSGADRREVRTAECDWYGAEESLGLARAAASGRLSERIASLMPAEITLMRIGPRYYAGWPCEIFVEFLLMVKAQCPNCHVVSLANGEMQGYLVTEEAVRRGWYEASNSLFAGPDSGLILVNKTLELIKPLTV